MTFRKAFKIGLLLGFAGIASAAFAGVSPFNTQNVSGCWNASGTGIVGTDAVFQTRDTQITGVVLDDGAVSGGEIVQHLGLPGQTELGGNMTCFFVGGSGTYSVDGFGQMTITDTFTPDPSHPHQLPGCLTNQTVFTAHIGIDSYKHGRGIYSNSVLANGQSAQGGAVEIYRQVDQAS